MIQTIGAYTFQSEIGRSEYTVTYRANKVGSTQEYAVKVLASEHLQDSTIRARYQREAQLIASLDHPAILPLSDFGEQDGYIYIVTPYQSNGSLKERLAAGVLSLDDATQLILQIAPALDAVHALGIMHGDLKPSNILFGLDGQPMLADFGMFKIGKALIDPARSILVGPPAYLSPELILGDSDVGNSSDIYMLGSLLFNMLAGQIPYRSETVLGCAVHHLTAPLPDILAIQPSLPKGVQMVIARCMAKDSQERFQSASEMADALTHLDKLTAPKSASTAQLPLPEKISLAPVTPHLIVNEPERAPENSTKAAVSKANSGFGRFLLGIALLGTLILVGLIGVPFLSRVIGVPTAFATSVSAQLSTESSSMLTPYPGSTDTAANGAVTPAILENTPSAGGDDETPTAVAVDQTPTPEAFSEVVIASATEYSFQSGDTLFNVAGKFQVGFSELLESNGLTCASKPATGVILSVPAAVSSSHLPLSEPLAAENVRDLINQWTMECIGDVNDLAIAPDGSQLAIASGEFVYIWQTAGWKPLFSLRGHLQTVNRVIFSPDGLQIATASQDATIKLWNAQNGELLFTLYGHNKPITDVAFYPNGEMIVSAAPGDDVSVWQLGTRHKEELKLDSVLSIAIGPYLALGTPDGVHLYNIYDLAEIAVLPVSGLAKRLTFSPDGLLLASGYDIWHIVEMRHIYSLSGSEGDTVFSNNSQALIIGNKIWKISNGAYLTTLSENSNDRMRYTNALSPDGDWLALGSKNGVSIWRLPDGYVTAASSFSIGLVAQGDTLYTIANSLGVRVDALLELNGLSCASPVFGGQQLLIPQAAEDLLGDNQAPASPINIDNLAGLTPISDLLMSCTLVADDIAFSPDGNSLVSGSALWDVGTRAVLIQAGIVPLGFDGKPEKNLAAPLLVFSPDQKTLAMREGNDILLWDVPSRGLIQILKGHLGPVTSIAFSPDGEMIASSGVQGEQAIRIWRVRDGKLLWLLSGYSAQNLDFTPDGSILIAVGSDSVRFWQVSEGKQITTVWGVDPRLDFSSDRTLLAYVTCVAEAQHVCTAEAVSLYSVAEGKRLPLTLMGVNPLIQTLSFSPDGQLLAAATGNGVTVWQLSDGARQHWLIDPKAFAQIQQVVFSPDGSFLVSVDDNGIVRFWRLSDGMLLHTIEDADVEQIAFSDDSHWLAALSNDLISLWGVSAP